MVSTTAVEVDVLQQIRQCSFSHWPHPNSFKEQMIKAGFFSFNVDDRVVCPYCNIFCHRWNSDNDNPSEAHKILSPKCTYVISKPTLRETTSIPILSTQMLRASSEPHLAIFNSALQQARWFPHRANAKKPCAYDEVNQLANKSDFVNDSPPANNGQILITDESELSRLVTARLDSPVTQKLVNRGIELSVIRRCWEDRLRLKEGNFASEYDLLIACVNQKKFIQYLDGKEYNIITPNIWMNQWEENQGSRNDIQFVEDEEATIQREQSFTNWPHIVPSRYDMLSAGWFLKATEFNDTTLCCCCDVRYDSWNVHTNPYSIHHQRSPLCPFVRSLRPIRSSTVPVKFIWDVFTQQRINATVNQPVSDIILTSNAFCCRPYDRARSFRNFPGGLPSNVDALVRSGFYYSNIGTIIRCYECGGVATNLHLYLPREVNTEHQLRFPRCRLAKMSADNPRTSAYDVAGQCKWCWKNPTNLVVDPCGHFAICDSCNMSVHTCPICGIKANNFMRIYK